MSIITNDKKDSENKTKTNEKKEQGSIDAILQNNINENEHTKEQVSSEKNSRKGFSALRKNQKYGNKSNKNITLKATEDTQRKNETIIKIVKNSESRLAREQRELLTYKNELLIPCQFEQKPDEFVLTFDVKGYTAVKDLRQASKIDKLRLLSNCAELEQLQKEYIFSLKPSNIMCDYNLKPRVLMRDIAPLETEDFLAQYKALSATLLSSQYSYSDFLEGGNDLYAKKPFLKSIGDQQTVDGLYQLLFKAYCQERDYIKKYKKLVNKANSIAVRIGVPLMAAAIVTLSVFCFKAYKQTMPFQKSMIESNNAYTAGNYVRATKALNHYEVDEIPFESKYILSRAYVMVEGLTEEQKKNVLSTLTLQTEKTVIDYWIYIGREMYADAIDRAKLLGDDELLLFALIRQDVALKNSTSLSGEEKAEQIASVESEIEALQEKMEESKQESDAAKIDLDAESAETNTETKPDGENTIENTAENIPNKSGNES